jgi:PAS domain S-box-containing protein
LIGVDGRFVNMSRVWPVPTVDLSDRDYIRHLAANKDAGIYLSDPVKNRITDTWTLVIARRIDSPEGTLLGIVAGTIQLTYLEDLYQGIIGQDGHSIGLMRQDGTVVAHFPPLDAGAGSKMPIASPWYAYVAQGGGTYRSPKYLDDIARVVSVRPLLEYPLVVTVTRSEEAALAHWRGQSALIAIGALCAVIGIIFMIRLLARSVDALRYSEERSRDLAEISSEWFWEQNAELRYTWFSDSVGRPGLHFNLIGMTRWEMVTEGVTDVPWSEHKAILAARRPFRDFRYIRRDDDGAIHHISVSGNPIFDERGIFQGYRGAEREITASVEAEQAMGQAQADAEAAQAQADTSRRAAEEASGHLLEAQRIGKIGHWITDEPTQTTAWSPQMFEIAGMPPGSVITTAVARAPLHPEDAASFLKARAQAIAARGPAMSEVRWVRPTGEIRWVHIEMSPRFDDDNGAFVSLFGTTQDITERKQAEEALKAAQRQLTDAVESISEGFVLFDADDRYVLTNTNYRPAFPRFGG